MALRFPILQAPALFVIFLKRFAPLPTSHHLSTTPTTGHLYHAYVLLCELEYQQPHTYYNEIRVKTHMQLPTADFKGDHEYCWPNTGSFTRDGPKKSFRSCKPKCRSGCQNSALTSSSWFLHKYVPWKGRASHEDISRFCTEKESSSISTHVHKYTWITPS